MIDFPPSQIKETVQQSLFRYFKRLSSGQDVSPRERFRLEGLLQACRDFSLLEIDEIVQLVDTVMLECGLDELIRKEQRGIIASAEEVSLFFKMDKPTV